MLNIVRKKREKIPPPKKKKKKYPEMGSDGDKEGDGDKRAEKFNKYADQREHCRILRFINANNTYTVDGLDAHMEHKCDGNVANRCFPCCPRFSGSMYSS